MTTPSDQFARTDLNTVKRLPKRGAYDKATIYEILDAGLLCHVAFVDEGQPIMIPTLYARDEDTVLLHGASTSRMLQLAAEGVPLCISVTHIDGLVLARSVFHHSVNYRSAVLFGTGQIVTDPVLKMAALQRFTEKLLPGRWADARPPAPNELKATMVIAVTIDSASAKIRTGDPGDDEADVTLPTWAGVLPLVQQVGDPIPAPNLAAEIAFPDYLAAFIAEQNATEK